MPPAACERGKAVPGPRRRRAILWVVSGVVCALALLLAWVHLPLVLAEKRREILPLVGAALWPALALAWLPPGRTRARRLGGMALMIFGGFIAQGTPPLALTLPIPFPNMRVLPGFGLALAWGAVLLWARSRCPRPRASAWAACLALAVAVLCVGGAVLPVAAVVRAPVGVSLSPSLSLADSYLLAEAAADRLSGLWWRDCLVLLCHDRTVWRTPDGRFSEQPDTWPACRPESRGGLEARFEGDRLHILDRAGGILRCYSYPDGELVWEVDGLGPVESTAWTADSLWVMAGREICRVGLRGGSTRRMNLTLPPGTERRSEGGVGPVVGCDDGETPYITGRAARGRFVLLLPRSAGGRAGVGDEAEPLARPVFLDQAADGDSLVVAGGVAVYGHGEAWAGTDLRTGRRLWQMPRPAMCMRYPVIAAAQGLVFTNYAGGPPDAVQPAGEAGGYLSCIEAVGGEVLWRRDYGQLCEAVAVARDVFLLTDHPGPRGDTSSTARLVAEGGQVRWETTLPTPSRLVSLDRERGIITLMASPTQEVPTGPYWGREVALDLDDGAVLPVGEEQPCSYRYLLHQELISRTRRRMRNASFPYTQCEVVLKPPATPTHLADLAGTPGGILADSDGLAAACRAGENAVLLYILQRSGE